MQNCFSIIHYYLLYAAGLIKVTGSANYFRKKHILTNDETATLIFQSKAYYDVIPVSEKLSFEHLCNHKKATHVVSKIVYGQNAYFYFTHKYSKSDEDQKVGGSLYALLKRFHLFPLKEKRLWT